MMSLSQQPAESQEPLDAVARLLYEAERAAHPTRNMPSWERANRVLCADARHRAQGAHARTFSTVKAVLVERLAQALATLDGYVWPSCAALVDAGSPEYCHARAAERRQRFRHKAREVITVYESYLDVQATREPEEVRTEILAQAKQQQAADVRAVQAWHRVRDRVRVAVIDRRRADGAVDGDGRN